MRKTRGAAFAGACLGAVAALALLAAPAATPASSIQIVVNGGAETGPVAASDAQTVAPTGWTVVGSFTGVAYGAPTGFPAARAGAAPGGGANFFSGGPSNASSSASQVVKIPAAWVKPVSTGRVRATASAALGGYSGQPDSATVTYVFLAASGAQLGSVRLGPVTVAQRASETKLLPVSKQTTVPAKTRSVKITIAATRGSGAYNDGYADNVSLVLRR